LYPILLVIAWFWWFAIESPFDPRHVVRPLLMAVAVTIVVCLAARWLMGDRHLAALTSAIVAATMIGGSDDRVLILGVVSVGLLLLVRALWSRQPPAPSVARRLPALTTVGQAVALIFALAVALHAIEVIGTADASAPAGGPGDSIPASSPNGPRPDIFVLLLDGHPRFDTLQTDFGYDGQPLADALRAAGFTIAAGSRSNYPVTGLSLASILDYRHIGDIPAFERLGAPNEPHIDIEARSAINASRGLRLLQSAGYERVAISPGYLALAIESADRIVDTGQISDLDTVLARGTAIGRLVEAAGSSLLADQFRDRVDGVLAAFERELEWAGGPPRFVLAHVPAPHGPMVFAGESGESVTDLDAIYHDRYPGLSDEQFVSAYARHVKAVDERVTAVVREIPKRIGRPSVTLVISDHGVRAEGILGIATTDPTPHQIAQQYRNLFAWRSDIDLGFGDHPTLVNLLPILFDRILGTSIACSEGRMFAHYPSGLVEFADPDDGSFGSGAGADEPACRSTGVVMESSYPAG
jgi:hypothetical protein